MLTKPPGALGRLEEVTHWLCLWQARHPPRLDRARVAVFAGNHGVAARGVSAYPAEVTKQMVANFIAGGAAVNQLCLAADAELRVYEMDLDHATADFSAEPAMSEEECAKAFAYGMMAVETGPRPASASARWGSPIPPVRPPSAAPSSAAAPPNGSAPAPASWARPWRARSPWSTRRWRCIARRWAIPSRSSGAWAGGSWRPSPAPIIAARLAHVPVLLDGFAATAAASVLEAAMPGALDHCLVAHCSAEPGHRRLLERLGKKPLLDLGMRLGEASGAALAIPLLRAAVACHTGMASFAEAGVSDKSAE